MNDQQRAAMQMALEALNAMLTHMGMDEDDWNKPTFDQAREAITALREALEVSSGGMESSSGGMAQPQGEPVGCLNVTKWKGLENYDFDYYGSLPDGAYTLYTTPPSVEAAIEATKEATKERAARICDVVLGDNEVSAVIRSMK